MKIKITSLLMLASAMFSMTATAQWQQITAPTSGKLEALWFLDENTGFTSGGFVGKLFKTTDGGLTWTDFSNNPVREIQFLDSQTGYASSHTASAVGTMQKTTNGGATFTGITAPNSSSFLGD